MALTLDQITAQNFADFYQKILPYLNGGGMGMKLLWENPNPTSAFAAGNVKLSSSDYDLYLVLETDATTSYVRASSLSPKGLGGFCNWCLNDNNKAATSYRLHSFVDDTTIGFNDCYYSTVTATSVTNAYLIPYRIYGIKVYNRDVPSTQIVKTGTTMADLISAIGALTEWQKNNCIIKITYSGNDLYMRRKLNNHYATGYVGASNNNGTVREYYLETAQSKFSYVISTGTTTVDQGSLSFTSWELYYQG